MAGSYRVGVDVSINPRSLASSVGQVQSAFSKANFDLNKIEKFNGALGKISANASELDKSLDAATARVFAFGAAVGVINAVTQSFRALVNTTIEVEKRLIEINSIFGATSSEFEKFRTSIFNVAKNTGQNFGVVADAAAELARQGLSASETADRLNASLILTRVGALDSVKAVESLTATINGFASAGLTANQIVNKIVAVDQAFAVSAGDLAESFARVGSTAEDAGVSLDELFGIVTAVQQTTSRGGAVIGNALKTIFTRISRSDTISQLQALGVEIDASQNGIQKLQALSDALRQISDPAVSSQIKELAGGVFQINVVSAALKDLGKDTSIFSQASSKAANASNEAFAKNAELNKSLSSQINALVAGLTNVSEKIGQIAVAPLFTKLISLSESFVGFLDRAFSGEKAKKTIEFFFATLGNFISGPGIVILGAGFAKIFTFISKFAADALKQVFDLNGATSKVKNVQNGIVLLLEQDENLRKIILSSTVSQAQKEDLVLRAIQKKNSALQYQKTLVQQIASSSVSAGVSNFSPTTGFKLKRGTVPNFAKTPLEQAIQRERNAGIPISKIRVNADKRLISSENPLGLERFIARKRGREIQNRQNNLLVAKQNRISSLLFGGVSQSRKRLFLQPETDPLFTRRINPDSLSSSQGGYLAGRLPEKKLSSLKNFLKKERGGAPKASSSFLSGASKFGASAGGALGGIGLLGALIGPQLIENLVLSNSDSSRNTRSLTRQVNIKQSQIEEAQRNNNLELVEKLTKEQEKLNRELSISEQETSKLASKLNTFSSTFAVIATILPSLLAAGGKSAVFGIGGTLAALGFGAGTLLDRFTGLSDKISDSITGFDKLNQINENLNTKEFDATTELTRKRLSDFSSKLVEVSNILSTDFSATIKSFSFSGVRGESGRVFQQLGAFGASRQLDRSKALSSLAQDFLPDRAKINPLEEARREAEIETSKIKLQFSDIFDKLAEGFGEFRDETDLSQQKLKKLEEAFKSSISSGVPLEKALNIFKNVGSGADAPSRLRGEIAREILSLRSGEGNTSGNSLDIALSLERYQKELVVALNDLGTSSSSREQEDVVKRLVYFGNQIDGLSKSLNISNPASAAELIKKAIEQDAIKRLALEEARTRQELDVLNRQKEIQDKFIDDLKATFRDNVENVTNFNPNETFPSTLTSINDKLENLGLSTGQRGDILSQFGAGNIDASKILENTRSLQLALNTRRSAGQGIGAGEIGLIRSQIDLAGAQRRIESISQSGAFAATATGRQGINQLLDFVKFLQSGDINTGSLVQQLANTRGSIGSLEGLQRSGRVSEQDVNNLSLLIANLVKSVQGVTKTAGFGAESATQEFFSNQVSSRAGDVESLAEQIRKKALEQIDSFKVALKQTNESVIQNIATSSNDISLALDGVAEAIRIKTGEIINIKVPTETTGTRRTAGVGSEEYGPPLPSPAGSS